MPLTVNLRHLDDRDLELRGELSLAELDFDVHDEMIRVTRPLRYELEVEKLDDSLLVQGSLQLPLACRCVRCLQEFEFALVLDAWTQYLPLAGEDAVPVKNDSVDLTPWVREDILLEFPRHPLCKPDCVGLRKASVGKARKIDGKDESVPSAWAELNKLKL
jgi:uncharacterized protein